MGLGVGLVKVELMPSEALGAWVDVSSYVNLTSGVSGRPAGPSDVFQPVEAGTWTFVLYAHDGVWWPENPGSPYFGQIVEGMPCRITGTVGTTTSVRHLGRIRIIDPEVQGSVEKGAQVTFTSSDVLADLGGVMRDRLTENLKNQASIATYSNGPNAWDSWPLTDDTSSQVITSGRPGGNNGQIYQPKSGAGVLTLNQLDGATHNGPLSLPNMATFEPVNGVGPVIGLPLTSQTSGQFYIAWRTTSTQQAVIAAGYDKSGTVLWKIVQLIGGGVGFYDSTNALLATMNPTNYNDGTWHTVVILPLGAGVPSSPLNNPCAVFWDAGSFSAVFDPSAVRSVTVGGAMNPFLPGKQSQCFTGDIGMIGTLGATNVGGLDNLCCVSNGLTNTTTSATQYLSAYARAILKASMNVTATTTATNIANFPTQDVSYLDALNLVAQSSGSQLTVDPSLATSNVAKVSMRLPEAPAPNLAPAFTLTTTNDDDGTWSLVRGAADIPTRSQVQSPLGLATYVGDESQRRLDDTFSSVNYDSNGCYAIAGSRVNRPRSSRLTPINVDLATAIGTAGTNASAQTLATAILAAVPMVTTFTLGSMPSGLFGRSQQDQLIVGWTETWTVGSTVFQFSCLPTSDLPDAVFDGVGAGADYSRFGAGGVLATSNGAALGTGTGALTVTSTADLMLTGTSLTWNWNGEAVTGTVSGATSPQTVTITARAQRGTVARTHANVEPFDVWLPATFGY